MLSKRVATSSSSSSSSTHKRAKTTAAIKIVYHAGMGGYLPGESPKGYKEGSKVGERKHLINPRLNFEAALVSLVAPAGSEFVGPVVKPDGGGLLGLTDATRSSPNGVQAALTFLDNNVEASDQVIICTSGPGAENMIDAIAGRVRDFKTRCARDLPHKDTIQAIKPGLLATIRGYVFITPITVTKKNPEQVPNESRIAPLLSLEEGTKVLIVTGDKDTENLRGLRICIDRMQCKATTQLHVVASSRHNPFDSTPVRRIAEKNTETQEVLHEFLKQCCDV